MFSVRIELLVQHNQTKGLGQQGYVWVKVISEYAEARFGGYDEHEVGGKDHEAGAGSSDCDCEVHAQSKEFT